MDTFAQHMHVKVIHVDASPSSTRARRRRRPESKRKIIGKHFVEVFQREAAKVKNAKWLAQGRSIPT
jgi:GMP synthase (glutamine-hydrolysing)